LNFANHHLLDRLIRFDESAGQLPITPPVARCPAHKQELPFTYDRAADADVIPSVVAYRNGHDDQTAKLNNLLAFFQRINSLASSEIFGLSRSKRTSSNFIRPPGSSCG
jgi:hypothetical protein